MRDTDPQTVREALFDCAAADGHDDPGLAFERISKRLAPMVNHSRADEFKCLCDPLIKWLNDNFHPHVSVYITPTSAELSSGETAYTTEAFLRD